MDELGQLRVELAVLKREFKRYGQSHHQVHKLAGQVLKKDMEHLNNLREEVINDRTNMVGIHRWEERNKAVDARLEFLSKMVWVGFGGVTVVGFLIGLVVHYWGTR